MYGRTEGTSHLHSGAAAGLLESDGTEEAALSFLRCTWCGTVSYRRILCPACQSTELRSELSGGMGTVRHSRVILSNTPFARNVTLVEMTEGFVVRGRVMGGPVGIFPGARVQLFTTRDSVRGEPLFKLVDV